jgi:drug/metabolite transporter (DMT)-like permease
VLGAAAVSTSAILARVAMGDDPGVATAPAGAASALAVAFWRTALGALALAPLALRARVRRGTRLPRTRQRQLAASGLSLALHFALVQGWFLRERTHRRTWIGMALTMVGAIIIGVGDATAIDLGRDALIGDAMAFGGALAITGYLLVGRVARRDVPATVYSCVVYGWAALALLCTCLALGVPLVGYSTTTWLAILGIVVGPQLLGHTVFNALLANVPATVVSIVVLSEPVGAGVLAWLLLGELPAGLFALGAPLVLVGVGIATARRRRPREAAETAAT